MFTGGNPVLLGVWVDLEDVGPCTEDRLLAVQRREETEGVQYLVKGLNPEVKLP